MEFCCTYTIIAVVVLFLLLYLILRTYTSGGMCHSNVKLNGKTVVITGANTGLGKETAKDLAKRGATVIMACRNLDKGKAALEEVKEASGSKEVYLRKLDLSSLKSVKEFAETVLREFKALHILINNAGVMMCPYSKTTDGFEMQIGVNHFGHFALTNLLLKRLVDSGPSRIVNVASIGHIWYNYINMDDLNWEKTPYDTGKAYGQSKLSNVLFTKELHRKLVNYKVTTYCLHPGVVNTNLSRHLFFFQIPVIKQILGLFFKTPEQGAQTSIYCAVEEGLEKKSGGYFADCHEAKSAESSYDEGLAKKLWEKSEELTGVSYPL